MRYHRGMDAMTLRIRLFAGLKDRLGRAAVDLAVPIWKKETWHS